MARKRTGLNACGGYKYNGNTYTAQELFNMLKDGELENLVKEGKITINPEDMPLLAEKYQGIEAASNKQPVEPMANTGFKEGDVVHFRFRGKAQTVQSKAKIEQVIEKDGVPAFVKLEGINKQIPITDISTQPFGGVEEAKKAEAKKEEVVAKTRFEKAKERGIAIVNAINATKAKVYSFVDEKVLEQSGWTKKSVMDFQKAFNNAFNSTKLGNKRLGKDVQIVLMNNSQMLDWVAENQPQAYKSAVAGKLDIKGVLVNPEGTLVIINVDKASNTTPLHEIAGHIWEMWAKKNAKPLYQAMIKKVGETKYFAMLTKAQDMLAEGKSIAQVMQSLKNTKEFKSIFADKKATEGFLDLMQYITHGVNSKLSRAAIDDVLRSEIFAKVIETNADILAAHEDKSVIQSFKDFIAELFKKLSEVTGFKGLNYKALGEMDINQFAQAVLSELSKGELSTDIARKIRVAEAGSATNATESQIIPEATKRGQNVTEEEEFEVNETTSKEEPKKIDESEQEESVKEVTIEDAMNVIAESDEPNIYESMDVAEAAKMAMGKIPYVGRLFEYATNVLLKSKDEAKRAEAAELMDNPKAFLNSRLEDLKAAEQQSVATTQEATEQPAESGEIFVTGTTLGEGTIYGNRPDAFYDLRIDKEYENKTPQYFRQQETKDKKIFTLVDTTVKDDGGRRGFISVSISVDKNSDIDINDVASDLKTLLNRIISTSVDKSGKINEQSVANALKDVQVTFQSKKATEATTTKETEEITKEIAEIESAIAEIDRINTLVESANKVLTTFGTDGEVVSNVSAFSFIRSTPESILKPLLELVTKTQFFQDAKEVDVTTNPADILEGILTQRYTLSKEDRAIMGSIVEGPLKKFWDYHTAKLKSEDEFITSAKLQELFKKEYNKSVKTSAERETKRKIKSAKYKITKQAESVFKKVKDLERQLGDTTKDLSGEQKAAMRAEINELLKDFSKYSIASRELDHLAYDSFFYEDMNNAFGIEQFGEEGFYRILASMPYTRGKYVETTNLVTSYKQTSASGQIVGDNEVISSHNLKSEAGNVLATFEITKNFDTNEGHISFIESDKMFGDPKATKEAFIAATRMLQMDGFTPVIDQYLTGQTYDLLQELSNDNLLLPNKLAPKQDPQGLQDEVHFYGVPPFQYNFGNVLSIDPVNPKNLPLFSFSALHGAGVLFNKFDYRFMGTGEGAQAYGWGGYFATKKGIAKQYAINTSKKNNGKVPFIFVNNRALSEGEFNDLAWSGNSLFSFLYEIEKANPDFFSKSYDEQLKDIDNYLDNLNKILEISTIVHDAEQKMIKELQDKIKNVTGQESKEYRQTDNDLNKYIVDRKKEYQNEVLDEIEKIIDNNSDNEFLQKLSFVPKNQNYFVYTPFETLISYSNPFDVSQLKVQYYENLPSPKNYKKTISNFKKGAKIYDRSLVEKDPEKIYNLLKTKNRPVVYDVTLFKGKDPSEYEFLDWHKPIPQRQKEKIFEGLRKLGLEEKAGIKFDESLDIPTALDATMENLAENFLEIDFGGATYIALENLFSSQKEASLFLLNNGIDGVRVPNNFLAGNRSEDEMNYVVFDENAISIEQAKSLNDNPLPLPLFSMQTNSLEDDFYYPLERRLTEIKDEVKTGKQWIDILKGGDEYNFSNLDNYLKERLGEKINKQDLIDIFNESKPKFTVNSFIKGKEPNSKQTEADDIIKEYDKEVALLANRYLTENDIDEIEDLFDELENKIYKIQSKYVKKLEKIGITDVAEEDYDTYLGRLVESEEDIFNNNYLGFAPLIIIGGKFEENDVFLDDYSEYIQKGNSSNYNITIVSFDEKDLYTSSHFAQKNVVVHIRSTVRQNLNDEKVLFVEEIQSDWGQEGRKNFFKNEKGQQKYEEYLKLFEENKIKAKGSLYEIENSNANFVQSAFSILENFFNNLSTENNNFEKINLKTEKDKSEYNKAKDEFDKLFKEHINLLENIYPLKENENKNELELWRTPRPWSNYYYNENGEYVEKKYGLTDYLAFLQIEGYENVNDLKKKITSISKLKPKLSNEELSKLSNFHGWANEWDELEMKKISSSNLSKISPRKKLYSSAPFVTETNAWAKLGAKVAIQQAVKNGCTRIAWTTGEQQDEVNGKEEPTYHKFYGSPKNNELGILGNIFKKIGDAPIEITNMYFNLRSDGYDKIYSLPINNNMVEKTYQGMPMFSLGAPQTNAAVAPGSQTATPGQTVNNVGVTPNTAQVPALNAQQQGHINNIANSYRNLNPYTQISFQPFQPENKTILSNVNSFITRKTVASLGLGTEYLLAKESMVGYEANQKSELEKETKAALALLSSPKYADEPSMKGMTAEAKLNLINLALSGDPIAFNVLPADFQPVITGMRNRIDALSEAMIRSGWLKLSTAEAFDKGLGNHLRRQFKKFTLKEKAWEKFANNLDPVVRERAIRGFYTWVQEGFYQEPQTMAGYVPLYDRWKEYNKDEKAANKLETRLNALNSRLALKQQQLPQRQNQQQAQATIAKIQKDIADVTAQLNPLQAKLAAEFPVLDAATYDLAEKGLQDLLDAPEASSSLNPYTGSQIQMATLKKRLTEAEFPEWMRDVYGEIKDPVMNYQMTVSNLVNMTSRMKFLNDVYTLAKGDGFIYNDVQLSAKEREQLKKDGWINIDGTNEGTPQTRFGPFIGTWVKPELYEFAFGTDAEISTIYSVRGWVLIGKTAGNLLFGPIRNFFGNGSFLLVNGSATKFFANLKNGVSKSDFEYMKSLPGKNLGSKFYNFWDTAIDDAEKLGLFQTVNTDWAKETFNKISKDTVLMKAFEKSEAEGWSYFYKNYVCNLGRWVKDGAVQSYIWADILPKLTSFTTSRNHLANKLAVAAGLPSGLSYNTLANPNPAHPLYNEIISKIKPEQMAQINRMAGHQTNVSMVTSDRVAPIVANMPKKTVYKGKSAAGKGAAATKDALTLIFGGDFPRFVAESMRIFLQQLGNVATINKTYESKAFKVFEDEKENSEFLKSLNVEQRAHTLAGLIGWSGVMSQVVPYFGGLGASLLAMAGLGGDDDDENAETDNNQSVQVSTKPGFTTEGFMNKNRNLGAEMYRLYQAKVNGGMSIDEALREVSREFEQNHQLDFKLLGDGKFMRQDVSSVDPFTVFTAIPRSIIYRPERGFYNKLTGGVSSLYDEYLGVEMGVSNVLDLVKNQNPYTGLPIYNEEADFFGKKGAAMLYHSVQTLAPTFITKALKMYEKSQDKVNQRTGEVTEGKPLDKQMLIELQSAAYGRTYYEENPKKLLHNLIKPLYSGKAGAVRQKTYFKDLDILKDVCYKMNRKVQAMRTLGMKEDEIAEVLGDIIREDSIWEAAFYGGSYIDNLELDENND